MKIAVCLTGLYNIDLVNIKKVFKIFDCIAEKSNVQFDFYMQFWDKSNYYFYDISEEVYASQEFSKIPTYLYSVHTELIEYIKPKDTLWLNYTDVVLTANLKTDGTYTRDENNHLAHRYTGPNTIDVNTFSNHTEIQKWCGWHNWYVDFVNRGAQFYALQEIVKTIPKNTYDVILKWRYDVVCDHQLFCDNFDTNFSVGANAMYTPRIFRKKKDHNIEELRNIIARNEEYVYAIIDMFMYGKDDEFRRFSDGLLDFSIIDFDHATKLFRSANELPFLKYSQAAPMEETAFLNKMYKEKLIVRQIGTYDMRIIHPSYIISDTYYDAPREELSNMESDCKNRHNMYEDTLQYRRGELHSETNRSYVVGESIFKLK